MGDTRRFDLFARTVAMNFPPNHYSRVGDIAGGFGHLQLALREKGFKHVVTFDKRSKHIRKHGTDFRHRLFGENVKEQFDLLVGMHPDEATDVIITEAAKRKIPFVVCPCCIKPHATVFNEQHKFGNWVAHLKRIAQNLGYQVEEFYLKMNGKNLVLIGKPIY